MAGLDRHAEALRVEVRILRHMPLTVQSSSRLCNGFERQPSMFLVLIVHRMNYQLSIVDSQVIIAPIDVSSCLFYSIFPLVRTNILLPAPFRSFVSQRDKAAFRQFMRSQLRQRHLSWRRLGYSREPK